MPAAPPRPPALTLTCAFIGAGSLLALFELVGLLSNWGSIEVREGVRDLLSPQALEDADVSFDELLSGLRVAAYVGLVLATCGAVFALYAARGHRASRIMLTVLALLASILFAGLFAVTLSGAALLAVLFTSLCISSLWTADSRRWYAAVQSGSGPDGSGQDARESPTARATADSRRGASGSEESTTRPDPFGGPSPVPAASIPTTESESAPGRTAESSTRRTARPAPLTSAAVITLVSSALVGLFGLLTLLTSTLGADLYRDVLSQPGATQDLLRSSDLTADDLITAMRWISAAWIALCAAAIPSAVAALRGSPAGVVAVRVCAVLTLPLSVLGTFAGILTGGAAIVVLVLLARPEVKHWTQQH